MHVFTASKPTVLNQYDAFLKIPRFYAPDIRWIVLKSVVELLLLHVWAVCNFLVPKQPVISSFPSNWYC